MAKGEGWTKNEWQTANGERWTAKGEWWMAKGEKKGELYGITLVKSKRQMEND